MQTSSGAALHSFRGGPHVWTTCDNFIPPPKIASLHSERKQLSSFFFYPLANDPLRHLVPGLHSTKSILLRELIKFVGDRERERDPSHSAFVTLERRHKKADVQSSSSLICRVSLLISSLRLPIPEILISGCLICGGIPFPSSR